MFPLHGYESWPYGLRQDREVAVRRARPLLTVPVKPDEVYNAGALLRLTPLKLGTVHKALPSVTCFVTLTGPVG
jgi:hypothetical protein